MTKIYKRDGKSFYVAYWSELMAHLDTKSLKMFHS